MLKKFLQVACKHTNSTWIQHRGWTAKVQDQRSETACQAVWLQATVKASVLIWSIFDVAFTSESSNSHWHSVSHVQLTCCNFLPLGSPFNSAVNWFSLPKGLLFWNTYLFSYPLKDHQEDQPDVQWFTVSRKGSTGTGYGQDASLDISIVFTHTSIVFTHTGSQSSSSLAQRHTHVNGTSLLGSVNYASP